RPPRAGAAEAAKKSSIAIESRRGDPIRGDGRVRELSRTGSRACSRRAARAPRGRRRSLLGRPRSSAPKAAGERGEPASGARDRARGGESGARRNEKRRPPERETRGRRRVPSTFEEPGWSVDPFELHPVDPDAMPRRRGAIRSSDLEHEAMLSGLELL